MKNKFTANHFGYLLLALGILSVILSLAGAKTWIAAIVFFVPFVVGLVILVRSDIKENPGLSPVEEYQTWRETHALRIWKWEISGPTNENRISGQNVNDFPVENQTDFPVTNAYTVDGPYDVEDTVPLEDVRTEINKEN